MDRLSYATWAFILIGLPILGLCHWLGIDPMVIVDVISKAGGH